MKAAIFEKYGNPEVLKTVDAARPVPAENQVLIKVHASTVTSGDCPRRSGKPFVMRFFFGITKPKKGFNTPGSEFAGEVIMKGKNVRRFEEGSRVFGLTGWKLGANAEYICLPENGMIETIPDNVEYETCAAVPFGGITALHFLGKANIRTGQKVLIYGASGSVGTAAVQLARHFGGVVTGVCSTGNVEMVKSLGAQNVIDYTREDFINHKETYDVIFDTVGKTTFSGCRDLLKPEGIYLATVFGLSSMLRSLWQRKGGKRLITGVASQKIEHLSMLKELLKTGKLHAVIDKKFPLEQIAEAHRYVETGHKKGSVVVTMG